MQFFTARILTISAVNGQKAGFTKDILPVYCRATYRQTNNQTCLHFSINLTSLVCGKTEENLGETGAGAGRTCKLHTQKDPSQVRPRNLVSGPDSDSHSAKNYQCHHRDINHFPPAPWCRL